MALFLRVSAEWQADTVYPLTLQNYESPVQKVRGQVNITGCQVVLNNKMLPRLL